MKKSDLKKVIKPLVKECIHEILIEEGVLSNIVSEVATGLGGSLIAETTSRPVEPQHTPKREFNPIVNNTEKINEQKKRMLDAIGIGAYNGVDLFEGTTPMAPNGDATTRAGSVDLGSSSDAGVDISSLMGGASKIWSAMK